MLPPAETNAGPVLLIARRACLLTEVTAVDWTGAMPASAASAMAVFVISPAKPGCMTPCMVIVIKLPAPAGILAVTLSWFPAPVLPAVTAAAPLATAVYTGLDTCAGIISEMTAAVASLGPVFCTLTT